MPKKTSLKSKKQTKHFSRNTADCSPNALNRNVSTEDLWFHFFIPNDDNFKENEKNYLN